MVRLVSLGVAAAFFFSSTFVLNRWFAVAGGHWVWTASLRYFYVFVLLTGFIWIRYGKRHLLECMQCVAKWWRFWLVAGGVGFGCFYSALCYAASYAPGWLVATSWQATILATPLVLLGFGMRVPLRGVAFSAVAFAGIVLVNWGEYAGSVGGLLKGMGPVLLAAVCYPFGNTLCGLAKNGGHSRVPVIASPAMELTFCRIWMMTCGAIPVLLTCILIAGPPLPTEQQLVGTAFISVSTGIIATGIFLFARHRAKSAYEVAAVDATQAGEVPFALAVEWALFSGTAPGWVGWCGLALVVGGISAYAFSSATDSEMAAADRTEGMRDG